MKSVQLNKLFTTYIYEYLFYQLNNERDKRKSPFKSVNKMAALTDEGIGDNSDFFVKHAQGREFQVFQQNIII
jgi:hypothetical protein